jgi:Flagellar hook capping protein - N-terminal region
MNGIQPIAMGTAAKDTGSSATTSANLNELGPDAFITLLTTQLQSQDPLNPMDPNQMVNELTSMNTLQQIMQIRQDMDSLLSTTQQSAQQPTQPAASKGSGSGGGSQAVSAATGMAPPPGSIVDSPSSAALSSGLAALVKSFSSNSRSGIQSSSNSQ